MKSVEGRKEEKGEEIKGKAIRPFVAEERRVKRIRCLKIIILRVRLNTIYLVENYKFIVKNNKK